MTMNGSSNVNTTKQMQLYINNLHLRYISGEVQRLTRIKKANYYDSTY